MEDTRTSSVCKNVNQKQYHILGGIAEISTTTKDLKVGEVVVATTLSACLFDMCTRQMDLREWQWIFIN